MDKIQTNFAKKIHFLLAEEIRKPLHMLHMIKENGWSIRILGSPRFLG